jgi:integrase
MTKEASELRRVQGVTKQAGTANWYFVKKVPDDLKDHPLYRGKTWACRESLRTSDLREANSRALAKLSELDALWRSLRAGRVQRDPASLTPEEVHAIAQGLRVAVLAEDQRQREDLPGLVASLRLWWSAKHPAGGRQAVALDASSLDLDARSLREALLTAQGDPEPTLSMPYLLTPEGAADLAQWPAWKGLPPPVRDVLVMRNLEALDRAKEAASRGDPSPFLVQAEAVAKAQGIHLGADGWLSAAAQGLRITCQEAFLIALEERVQRDRGRMVPTPAVDQAAIAAGSVVPVAASVAPAVTKAKPRRDKRQPVDILEADPSQVYLRDVLEDWKREGHDTKTVAKYERFVGMYEDLTDNPSMAEIGRPHGPKFLRALEAVADERGLSVNTIKGAVERCGTLLNHYSDRTGHLGTGLWARVASKASGKEVRQERDEWIPEELKRLFSLDIWQRYNVPDSANSGLDAAYWVTLIGLFTGCRITEAAQLLVDDLEERSGVWFLRFAVTREGQSLKADASERTIPLPQKLIDLGLIEYRDAIKEAGQVWLFPALTKDSQNNAGGGLSKWFSALKIAQGFRPEVVFHSFRGSVNTQLIRLGFAVEYRTRYIGQSPEGGVNVEHYDKLKPEDLIPLAQRLDFPFLDLPKVYTRPAWFPGWEPKRGRKKAA